MQIGSINSYSYNSQYQINKTEKPVSFCGFVPNRQGILTFNPFFSVENACCRQKSILNTILNELKLAKILSFFNFTTDAYKKLSEKDLEFLRARYESMKQSKSWNYYFNSAETSHELASSGMEALFNHAYGKGNYVIITIGRSLSSVGKVLGYKIGEENVINIPISKASRFNDIFYPKESADKELKYLIKYLETVGLSKEDIEKSGKHYILTDYCHTGVSLETMKNLFTSDKVWGKRDNVHSIGIKDILDAVDTEHIYNSAEKNDLMNNLDRCEYKTLSFVLQCHNFADISRAKTNIFFAPEAVKLMWFKLLDNSQTVHKPLPKVLYNPIDKI